MLHFAAGGSAKKVLFNGSKGFSPGGKGGAERGKGRIAISGSSFARCSLASLQEDKRVQDWEEEKEWPFASKCKNHLFYRKKIAIFSFLHLPALFPKGETQLRNGSSSRKGSKKKSF